MLGEDFMCFGSDSLARVCAELLRTQDKKLAVAETATGGRLANAFTDLCGATKFFAGGCVCYSNESKMQLLDVPEDILIQHGAVSAENAVAMAVGVAERLGADYGLAITGVDDHGTMEVGFAALGDSRVFHQFVDRLVAECPFEVENLGWVPTELRMYEERRNNDDEDDGA